MEKTLIGKVALVSGAGRGIGRAISLALADQGADVGLIARNRDQIDDTRAAISERGGSSVVLPGDVSVREDIERIVKTMMEPYGTLDILVNNAGVHTAVGPVGDDDPEAWWHDVAVNLRGTYLLSRTALPFMSPGGTIINVSSGAGMKAFPYSSAYGASKAALIHFTETLHLELESKGISVFAIRPGAVRTSITNILSSQKGKQYLGHIAKLFEDDSDLLVSAEFPAQLVVRLCSPKAAVLSGRMISVLDDIDLLIEKSEQIRAEQLYLLRLRTL